MKLHNESIHFGSKEWIGEGAFAQIYRAQWNDIPVVLKRGITTESPQQYGYVSELHVMRSLRHPNIVTLFGYITVEHPCILVLEYAEKGTLEFHERQDPYRIPLPTRYQWSLDLLRAVAYLHDGLEDKKIIHRDIKPSNIFIFASGQAKLGDFGLARICEKHQSIIDSDPPIIGNLPHYTSNIGTLNYMAPEIMVRSSRSSVVYDESIDLFSVGVVLYELFDPIAYSILLNSTFLMSRTELRTHKYNLAHLAQFVDSPSALRPMILKLLSPVPSTRPRSQECYHWLTDIQSQARCGMCCAIS